MLLIYLVLEILCFGSVHFEMLHFKKYTDKEGCGRALRNYGVKLMKEM